MPLQAKDLAQGVLSRYIEAALKEVRFRETGSNRGVIATIEGIDELRGRGQSKEEALRDLRRALEFFVVSSIHSRIKLPVFGGIILDPVKDSM